MINQILQLLVTGLQLWQSKEATKYMDKVIALKKRYHNEMAKAENERSDAELDNIEFELRVISAAFCLTAQGSHPQNIP